MVWQVRIPSDDVRDITIARAEAAGGHTGGGAREGKGGKGGEHF